MNQIEEVMELVCAPKYLEEGENFHEGMFRIADHLKDDEGHFQRIKSYLRDQLFLPGGRIQASAGATKDITAFNCFVSPTIDDSMEGIMDALTKAAMTLRLGGGDGFDFSTLRPKGAFIRKLGSTSSGPIAFMEMWDAMCNTIKSAGHRRGAMMATMRVDHPDIEEFITCKQVAGKLTNFNISVLVTDKFMEAVENDDVFDLVFDGVVYKTIKAKSLWNKIMWSTWHHAEPGVLFIDKINRKNNLWYCEEISATNPCGEQPLPPHGACLLGSWNLVKFCEFDDAGLPTFNHTKLRSTISDIVRMMDNVIDRTTYPLPEQEAEAKNKRRMGLGITGLANTLEFLGIDYGSPRSLDFLAEVMTLIRDECYQASIKLATQKGPFPAFDKEKYLEGEFIKTLPEHIRKGISDHGIRNSHLLSIAPTGTISLWARNVSSGIEPVFSHEYDRTVIMPGNDLTRQTYTIQDYAYAEWGLKGITSGDISARNHIDILCVASQYVDSACSKTANVGEQVTFEEFKDLYHMAYVGGASGCTTFRPSAIRGAILTKKEPEGEACFIDPETGERSCAD